MIDRKFCSIQVEGISKCYQIYGRPQDRVAQAILPRLQRAINVPQKKYFEEFWALRDVSLSINTGETVGIIGRNGSGKSTLLQIIAGTLQPTSGKIQKQGRIAALLELGSGFNPEFTGRENVFLNAAVLGLSNDDISSRYQSIVDFADIGDFIDQPVKTYSSGMVVRLAFAVIAHVDADILIIDEALAVGDAIFTQKCMRFLRKFRESGTLLFVSHDTASVINLCDRALWLHKGEVVLEGKADQVAQEYIEFSAKEVAGEAYDFDFKRSNSNASAKVEVTQKMASLEGGVDKAVSVSLFSRIENSEGWSTGEAEIESVEMLDENALAASSFSGGERVLLRIRARAHSTLKKPILGFFLKDRLGQSLFGEHTYLWYPDFNCEAGNSIEADFSFRLPLLPNGSYSITVSVADGDPYDHIQHHWLHDAAILEVSSEKLRYGLVGIPFESVEMRLIHG